MNTNNVKAISLVVLIIVIGVIGMFVLIGLGIAWSRHQHRQKHLDNQNKEKTKNSEYVSIWEQSGQRLKVEKSEDDEDTDEDFRRMDFPDDDKPPDTNE